jgi:hypothetical protein
MPFRRLLAAFALVAVPGGAFARDVPYGIVVNGRRVDASSPSGLNRGGITFIEAARANRTFDGLLTIAPDGTIRLSVRGRTLVMREGETAATVDGMPIALPAAPFARDGDAYVPLSTVARLGHAALTVETHARRAMLRLGQGVGFRRVPPAGGAGDDADVQPSPTQALTFATSSTADAEGLHARVEITNVTAKPYGLTMPDGATVEFALYRNGESVWRAATPAGAAGPTTVTFAPLETKTFAADDPGFAALGPGRYLLRVRLLTIVPLEITPLPVAEPAPSR